MDIQINDEGLTGIANYEPLKAWALDRVNTYKGLIVTNENIALAKSDTADLRKTAKTASDLRIQIKKDHEAKISKTIEQLKEITDIFTQAADGIATQVKEIEEKQKFDKKVVIENFFDSIIGDLRGLLEFDRIYQERWLNKGETIESIQESIQDTVNEVRKGLTAIRSMGVKYETEMVSTYLKTLNMVDALNEKELLEQKEAALLNVMKEEVAKPDYVPPQPYVAPQEAVVESAPESTQDEPQDVQIIDIRVFVTEEQKVALREFLKANKIKCTSVPKGE